MWATPFKTNTDGLATWGFPAIVSLGSHYVALLGAEGGRLVVFDNVMGLFDCTPSWFSRYYKWQEGPVLLLGPPSPAVVLSINRRAVTLVMCTLSCAGLVMFTSTRCPCRRFSEVG